MVLRDMAEQPHLVQQQLQGVGEVWQLPAGVGHLPSVVAKVSAQQLAQQVVEVHLTLKGQQTLNVTNVTHPPKNVI